ncbi:MAG: glucokinase [Methyloceanibacter sp.]
MPPERALVADIGGTNARFAIADLETLRLSEIGHFLCSEHPTLERAACAYLCGLKQRPRHGAIAVAAPVGGEEVKLTNSLWSFAKRELCRATGLDGLLVLNDFQALALSLPHLGSEELSRIGGGEPLQGGTKVVLGPGTGIGVAGLVWGGTEWVAVPSEGGHISLAPNNSREFAIAERLRSGRAHLSVERVLSGPGLAHLYCAVAASHGESVEPLSPNEVLTRALAVIDPMAVEALGLFVAWLGSFAGDAALLFGARGGVYLGGGIAPKMIAALSTGAFRHAFEEKGRMRSFLAPIPVYVILAEFATLKGAAAGLRTRLAAAGAELARPLT